MVDALVAVQLPDLSGLSQHFQNVAITLQALDSRVHRIEENGPSEEQNVLIKELGVKIDKIDDIALLLNSAVTAAAILWREKAKEINEKEEGGAVIANQGTGDLHSFFSDLVEQVTFNSIPKPPPPELEPMKENIHQLQEHMKEIHEKDFEGKIKDLKKHTKGAISKLTQNSATVNDLEAVKAEMQERKKNEAELKENVANLQVQMQAVLGEQTAMRDAISEIVVLREQIESAKQEIHETRTFMEQEFRALYEQLSDIAQLKKAAKARFDAANNPSPPINNSKIEADDGNFNSNLTPEEEENENELMRISQSIENTPKQDNNQTAKSSPQFMKIPVINVEAINNESSSASFHRPPPSKSAARNRQSIASLEPASPLLGHDHTMGSLVRTSPTPSKSNNNNNNNTAISSIGVVDDDEQPLAQHGGITKASITVFPSGIGLGRVVESPSKNNNVSIANHRGPFLNVVHPAHQEIVSQLQRQAKDVDEIIESLLDLEENMKKKADVQLVDSKASTHYCQELVFSMSEALATRMVSLQTSNTKEVQSSLSKVIDEVRRTAAKLELTQMQEKILSEKANNATGGSAKNMIVKSILFNCQACHQPVYEEKPRPSSQLQGVRKSLKESHDLRSAVDLLHTASETLKRPATSGRTGMLPLSPSPTLGKQSPNGNAASRGMVSNTPNNFNYSLLTGVDGKAYKGSGGLGGGTLEPIVVWKSQNTVGVQSDKIATNNSNEEISSPLRAPKGLNAKNGSAAKTGEGESNGVKLLPLMEGSSSSSASATKRSINVSKTMPIGEKLEMELTSPHGLGGFNATEFTKDTPTKSKTYDSREQGPWNEK